MTVGLKWAGSSVTASVWCWTRTPVENKEDSDEESERDDDDDDETEDSDDEDNWANYATDLCAVGLTDESISILQKTYPRIYENYLWFREYEKRHPKILPTYGSSGMGLRCRCGYLMKLPWDQCVMCQQ